LNIGILGLGHWGPNYVRVMAALEGVKVTWACDKNPKQFDRIKNYPDIRKTSNMDDLINDETLNAVVVVTPAATHFELAKTFLLSGKDVLAEKPLATTAQESEELCRIAQKKNRILMVAHIFLYNAGIQKVKELIEDGELGKLYYLKANRTHLGLIRDDVNVAWDLAPHDISIFNYFLGSSPQSVHAIGACHLKGGKEDVAFINLTYPNNVVANIHVSWEDSNKERTITLVGSRARVVFNDLDNLEKVKLFKKGISVADDYDDFGEFQLHLRDGDIISPVLKEHEPLKGMCSHFIDCIRTRRVPLTDGKQGHDVVTVMQEIQSALQSRPKE